jgi:hypothetical protein
MSSDIKTQSSVKAAQSSDRLARACGPGGIEANHSRIIAERASETATDDIYILSQPGVLRCCNCGLAVTKAMMLPVFDPYDAILGSQNPTSKGQERLDYVRVVFEYDELRTPTTEFSPFVACTPPCALRFSYDHSSFIPSQVPHLHAIMMWERHHIDEPTVAAPSGDCLAYVNHVAAVRHIPQQQSAAAPASSSSAVDSDKTHAKPSPVLTVVIDQPRGLSARSFYKLLSNNNLQSEKVSAPMYIPPMGDDEQTALERHDSRFCQYYFTDLLPPSVAAELKLPPELDDGGVQLDANPDSDTETDLALDVVHAAPVAPART